MVEKENKIRVWDIIFTVIVFIVSIFSLMRLTGYERIEDYYDNQTEYLTIQDVRPKYYKDGDWLENKISDFNIICATDTVYKEKNEYDITEERREEFRKNQKVYTLQSRADKYLGKWVDNGKDVYMDLYAYYLTQIK